MSAILLQTNNLKSVNHPFALEVPKSSEQQTLVVDLALVHLRLLIRLLAHLFPALPLARETSPYRISMSRTSPTPSRRSEQGILVQLAIIVNERYNGSVNSRSVLP